MEKYKEKVYFIGAGPGDPELITIKGQRIVKEADVIIYAGSLVPKEVIDCHKEGAEIYNSASMSLEKANKKVARVHTGDPAIYGAHREQMDMLDEYGIEYEVIPGVSSFLASAAALKKEFTLPTVSQTVICIKEAGINKTAQILVGDFLGDEYEKSKLYDKYFTHEYREGIKK